jgi:DNA mismatch repair protein MutS2
MSLNSIIFYDNLPKIDLHGEDSLYAAMKIEEFIQDNLKLKNKHIIIVHGIGSGILLKTTHDRLKNNKHVNEYKLAYNNNGVTLVELSI